MFYRSRRSGTNYQKVPTAGLYAEIRYLEKQKAENIFLEWLNPDNKKIFTWEETTLNIFKFSF